MRMDPDKAAGKERKTIQNASSKVNLVVQRMLLPLLDSPMRSHVLFDGDGEHMEIALLDHMSTTRPELLADEGRFLEHFQELFKRYHGS
jgi:hypothetical protein